MVVWTQDEMIVNHADHVRLNEGFEAESHVVDLIGMAVLEVGIFKEIVVLKRIGDMVVEGGGLFSIEKEKEISVNILVDIIAIVDGPSLND